MHTIVFAVPGKLVWHYNFMYETTYQNRLDIQQSPLAIELNNKIVA